MLPLPRAASLGSACLEQLYPWQDLSLPCSWTGVFPEVQYSLLSLGNSFLPPLDFPALLTRIHSRILIFILLSLPPFCYSMPELEKTNKPFTTKKALLLSLCAFLPVPLLYLSLLITPPPHFLSYYSCLSLAHFKIFLHLIDLVNENWIANNQMNFCVKTGFEGQDQLVLKKTSRI